MSTATARSLRRNARIRANGGLHTSLSLSRSSSQALEQLCRQHGLTRRDAIEAALVAAAMQGEAFDPRPLQLVREHGCSVDELRHASFVPHRAPARIDPEENP